MMQADISRRLENIYKLTEGNITFVKTYKFTAEVLISDNITRLT